MLKLDQNKLILSPELICKLQVNVGDKIAIEYQIIDGKVIPIILKSETGNLLTKSNTVAFKGKQNKSLQQFGNEFQVNDQFQLIGNKGDIVYAPVTQEQTCLLDKAIILDTNYNIEKLHTYEF